ncbi:SUR7/PalI family-domain-containing protein [Xylaria palmicola]|nr:SUR7/PalI family-domain-containing protein [Xylaria palmicola]
MVAKKPFGLARALAILLSLTSLLFTLITLLSGVGGHTTASYLTIDTTNLALPAKLSNSVFLQDLSKISGTDLVGQSRTRQTLGLSQTYRVSLLTTCGEGDDGAPTSCVAPRVGFAFDPVSDLKLDRAALAQGTTLSGAYYAQLRTYAAVSTFAAAAYILAALLAVASCLAVALSRRAGRAILVARVSSGLGAALVLAATVATIVVFVRLRGVFDGALGDLGVRTTTAAGAFGLSAAATLVSAAEFALVLFIRPETAGYGLPYHAEKTTAAGAPTSRDGSGAGAGASLLNRVQTWNRPRYAPIGGGGGSKLASGGAAHSRDQSPDSDREGLIDPAHDGSAPGGGYPRSLWGAKRGKRDLDHELTAYEPNAQ